MAGEPSDYVLDLHASVTTPDVVLESLVDKATGARIRHIKRIVEGYDNEVYRVRASGGVDLVVRVRRFGGTLDAARREFAAITDARSVGFPAPEVLLVESVHIGGEDYPVMVQRAVPGRPLATAYDSFSRNQQESVLAQLGAATALLHRVTSADDPREPIRVEVTKRRDERSPVISAGFTSSEFDAMIGTLEMYVEDLPDQPAVLCHGDLSTKHVFVDDQARLSGVIDFGDSHFNVPLHDFAVLRVRAPSIDLEPVLMGYGVPDTATFRRHLESHTLLIALSSLRIGVDEDDRDCINRLSALIRALEIQ